MNGALVTAWSLIWRAIRWGMVLLWRLMRWLGGTCWRLARRRSDPTQGYTVAAATAATDDSLSDDSDVMAMTPRQLLECITRWDRLQAQQLCNWLNGYDRLLRQGDGEATALDLRAVPTVDPAPFFPRGTPTNLVAIDQQGVAVIVNPAGTGHRYGVRRLSADV
ncbi:MAG: hypothetical protein HQL58_03340 [Magnetococcales bacterium]|nr:hypothetical protein [Magnetococcales bacterium]